MMHVASSAEADYRESGTKPEPRCAMNGRFRKFGQTVADSSLAFNLVRLKSPKGRPRRRAANRGENPMRDMCQSEWLSEVDFHVKLQRSMLNWKLCL
jgi:hypothetical protein